MTKEQLKEYRSIKSELISLKNLCRRLEAVNDPRLKKRYKKLCDKLAKELQAIENAIETLSPTERTIIRLRYIEGLSWQAICYRVGYEWAATHRKHASALAKLEKL